MTRHPGSSPFSVALGRKITAADVVVRRKAVRAVCAKSHSAIDAVELLDALDLAPEEGRI